MFSSGQILSRGWLASPFSKSKAAVSPRFSPAQMNLSSLCAEKFENRTFAKTPQYVTLMPFREIRHSAPLREIGNPGTALRSGKRAKRNQEVVGSPLCPPPAPNGKFEHLVLVVRVVSGQLLRAVFECSAQRFAPGKIF